MKGDGTELCSGGADALVTVWRDATKEAMAEQANQRESTLLQYVQTVTHLSDSIVHALCVSREQTLSNVFQRGDYMQAISLALTLDRPYHLRRIFVALLCDAPAALTDDAPAGADVTAHADAVRQQLTAVFQALPRDQLATLFTYVRAWNTNGRHFIVAQTVLHLLLTARPLSTLVDLPNIKEVGLSWDSSRGRRGRWRRYSPKRLPPSLSLTRAHTLHGCNARLLYRSWKSCCPTRSVIMHVCKGW